MPGVFTVPRSASADHLRTCLPDAPGRARQRFAPFPPNPPELYRTCDIAAHGGAARTAPATGRSTLAVRAGLDRPWRNGLWGQLYDPGCRWRAGVRRSIAGPRNRRGAGRPAGAAQQLTPPDGAGGDQLPAPGCRGPLRDARSPPRGRSEAIRATPRLYMGTQLIGEQHITSTPAFTYLMDQTNP